MEEKKEQAQLNAAAHKQRAFRYFNSKVKRRSFRVGDLVLRKIFQSTKEQNVGVLELNWEGPYRVVEIVKSGTYRLGDMNGVVLPHPWNAKHLRIYY